jgi:hypothetical protein
MRTMRTVNRLPRVQRRMRDSIVATAVPAGTS